MENLTNKEKFVANSKIERLVESVLALNPNSTIERVDAITVKINGFEIVCENFDDN